MDCKSKIYSEKADGVRIRSKYDLSKSGKKSNIFFFNLEKIRASQGLFRTLVKNEREISNAVEINTELQDFYK